MQHNCERHTFEQAEGVCKSCLGSFCPECLIFPWGPKKEPLCKPCAITAGGIRSTARNHRRTPSETSGGRDKRKSGGLLSRLRGSSGDEEPVPETPEEVIEREALEARSLLDAQRLPTEVDEPEVEPTPTPNIAPPGAHDEERELSHRAMPDSVSGGLDLGNADEPADTTSAEQPTDHTPDWARPESAGHEDITPPTAPVADDTPDWARPESAGLEDVAPTNVPAADETPEWARPQAADNAVLPQDSPPTPDDPPVTTPSLPVRSVDAVAEIEPEPVPQSVSTSADHDIGLAPPEPNPIQPPSPRTADGQELFTTPVMSPPAEQPAASVPVTTGRPDDTAELLRRIAELRGR